MRIHPEVFYPFSFPYLYHSSWEVGCCQELIVEKTWFLLLLFYGFCFLTFLVCVCVFDTVVLILSCSSLMLCVLLALPWSSQGLCSFSEAAEVYPGIAGRANSGSGGMCPFTKALAVHCSHLSPLFL